MGSPIVVFDLGGVMVEVTYQWGRALRVAGLPLSRPELVSANLGDCPTFEPYQAGKISLEDYLDGLAEFLELDSRETALKVHDSILVRAFDGSVELVEKLHFHGIRTACLSNTNAPHWDVMKQAKNFPAIAALQLPVLSFAVQLEKPHPAIYHKFQELAASEPSEIWFFEDTAVNAEAARNLGWNAFVVDPHNDPIGQVHKVLVEQRIL